MIFLMTIRYPLILRRPLSLLSLAVLCVACAPQGAGVAEPPVVVAEPPAAQVHAPLDKAQKEMASGIANYENGNYKLASKQLKKALGLGLKVPADKACAHKYLAFMHCVGGRQSQCRNEFRKALEADPGFDLTPAEAGHPTWGPVFRKLKTPAK